MIGAFWTDILFFKAFEYINTNLENKLQFLKLFENDHLVIKNLLTSYFDFFSFDQVYCF